jgi:hypothetical protein
LTLVKPDYSLDELALVTRLRYPINRLRNLALQVAPSPYVVVVDADFVPSPNMHTLLSTRGVPIIRSMAQGRSPTLHRTAIAVSAFALTPDHHGPFPSTPSELAHALYSTPPTARLTDANAGHGPSLPSLLFSAPPAFLQPLDEYPPLSWSYETCYESQWEPYYLLERASHPLYDERFTDQGGDKQSHALLLNSLGYRFRVLRDVWFMHPPRGSAEEDSEIDKWPSARLVSSSGSAPSTGQEKDHFSPAQKDEDRFRYFQDYVPELLARFGWNSRFPRGCSSRTVGRGSFGKARAGTVFGL